MTETRAIGYSSESTFQCVPTRQGLDGFQKSLPPCSLEESSFSIGRVKIGFKRSEFNAVAALAVCVQYPGLCSYEGSPSHISLTILIHVCKFTSDQHTDI